MPPGRRVPLDGRLHLIQFLRRGDVGQQDAARAEVDEALDDRCLAGNGSDKDGELSESADLTNMSHQFVGETAVLAIDDQVVEPGVFADFQQVRPSVIGSHHADHGFIGGETCFKGFPRKKHAIGWIGILRFSWRRLRPRNSLNVIRGLRSKFANG